MQEGPLLDILRRLGITPQRSHRRKGWLDFRCPLAPWKHRSGRDTHPSAGAKIEENGVSAWHCYTCKSHGRISSLVRALEYYRDDDLSALAQEADSADALSFRPPDDYADWAAGRAEEMMPPEPLEEALYDGAYPSAYQDPHAAEYLESRGIGPETAEKLGLVYDPEQQRVMFPVRDHTGGLYGFTGRGIHDGVQPKVKDYEGLPKRHLILGQERWRSGLPSIIVEGLFGYAHLVEIGVEEFANVGALMGSAMTQEKAERLLMWDGSVYLLFDNDQGGEDGLFGVYKEEDERRDFEAGAIGQLYKDIPVYVPAWPDGKEDPDELTLDEVQQMVSGTALFDRAAARPLALQPVAKRAEKKSLRGTATKKQARKRRRARR